MTEPPAGQRGLDAALALLLLLSAFPARAALEGFAAIGYTTDYVHHGLTQSTGEPAVQAGAGLRSATGLSLNAWISSIDISRQGPDYGDGEGIELNLLAGYGRPLGTAWRWDINAGRYLYSGEQRMLDYNYWEFSGALRWRERLRLSVAWTPEATDHTRRVEPQALDGQRTVVELSGEVPLRRWVSVGAGVGYNDSREVSDVTYTFWSAGATLRWRRFGLSLTHYATDADARRRWPDGRAADRFAATLVMTFG